jgi:hypothetical protein
MPPRERASTGLSALPGLIDQKLTKSGYTRGATPREIFQNRVTRNNPVLIELEFWEQCRDPHDGTRRYENGSIVLVSPAWYFETPHADDALAAQGLALGQNALLLLFRRRHEWNQYGQGRTQLPNGLPFRPAQRREAPLRGTYFARVHATVADEGGGEIVEGYNTTAMRGAGIRVFEYASTETIRATRLQLEALIWLCSDSLEAMISAGMGRHGAQIRRQAVLERAELDGLLDVGRLEAARIVDRDGATVCPLCLGSLSAADFSRRSEQAAGRATYDLTAKELSLFHVQELRVGRLQHKPYNLGWGHHFCNVVVKDAGILPTLDWMRGVLDNQVRTGHGDPAREIASVEEAVDW